MTAPAPPPAGPGGWITDGHEGWWLRCHRNNCNLHVTSPGVAMCAMANCPRRVRKND